MLLKQICNIGSTCFAVTSIMLCIKVRSIEVERQKKIATELHVRTWRS